jgi:hypothetical protein
MNITRKHRKERIEKCSGQWHTCDVTNAFNMEASMNTFTIRGMPIPVEKSLRRLAQESDKSLNKTVLELLAKATGVMPEDNNSSKHRDVAKVFQTWSASEYEDFQRNTKVFESIDEEMWRK